MDHQWPFDLTGETGVEFVLTASHATAGDPDDFVFEYSTDGGSSWSSLLAVTPTSPATQVAALTLPGSVGAVLVRVTDTDGSRDQSAATIEVDQMFFRRVGAAPVDSAPTTPGNSGNDLTAVLDRLALIQAWQETGRVDQLGSLLNADDDDDR